MPHFETEIQETSRLDPKDTGGKVVGRLFLVPSVYPEDEFWETGPCQDGG